jgi:hypothetical protein
MAKSIMLTDNQRRQLAHLLRNWPDIGQQVVAEVGALDDTDEIQQVISRGIYTAAGWWGWMPGTMKVDVDEWEREQRGIQTYDPHYGHRYRKYAEYKMR